MSFDAWGNRRMDNWTRGNPTIISPTKQGYTGHEQLDQHKLVHMQGRVYDPVLGRFLSADPYNQAPHNTQSYNRYSYVFNNPLSFVDPTGYQRETPSIHSNNIKFPLNHLPKFHFTAIPNQGLAEGVWRQ
jgi:RHS repeat-associated protein